MTDTVIIGAVCTAIGKFGGATAKMLAPEISATVIRALLARANLDPEQISQRCASAAQGEWRSRWSAGTLLGDGFDAADMPSP